jgi:hypothetical protein
LKDFFTWLVKMNIISQNPLESVCKKRNKAKKKNAGR